MVAIFSFKCSSCGETHEGSPSFGFNAPDTYLEQSDKTREAGTLGADLCQFEDEDGLHYFLRVVLEIPIHGASDPFLWGVWVAISEESFEHYVENCDQSIEGDIYFGWFCNSLPYYQDTYALATDVHLRPNGDRPYLAIHQAEHELYKDYVEGIDIEKARKVAELCIHG